MSKEQEQLLELQKQLQLMQEQHQQQTQQLQKQLQQQQQFQQQFEEQQRQQQPLHQPSTEQQQVKYVYSESNIRTPNFNWDAGDLPHEFKTFQRYCELIFTTPTYQSRLDKDKVSLILLWMGPKAVEIYDNWTNIDNKNDLKTILQAFKSYFEPKSNFRLARFQLRDMKQEPSESIDDFLTRLRVQSQKCQFENLAAMDDAILDQMIKGTAHSHVRKKTVRSTAS